MKRFLGMTCAVILCTAMLITFAAYADSSDDTENIVFDDTMGEEIGENTGYGKKVYIAGPMFNQAEKDFNLKIAEVLEDYGYQVFLPQRDGIEAAQLEGKTEEEIIEMIFELDVMEVQKADIVFMNLDGRVPDEGACVELGIAYACGKCCYGFKTDTRAIELGLEMNPMISGCMIKIFRNYDGDQLIEELRQYLDENELYKADTITEEQALQAVRNYCYKNDPGLKDMEASEDYTIYWDVSTNENSEIVVLYRSYTGAEIRYYIDPSSGGTYVTEFVQGITPEEEKTDESFNIKDYFD